MESHDSDDREVRANILTEAEQRRPAWLRRLETDNYYPVAVVNVCHLWVGDVVDVREFGFDADRTNAFLTLTSIRGDAEGVYTLTGELTDGTPFEVHRDDGLPMRRRRVVRYAQHQFI